MFRDRRLKRVLAAACSLALVGLAAACSSSDDGTAGSGSASAPPASSSGGSGGGSASSGSSAPAPMSITVASQRNSAGQSVWLAKELGYFEDNGLDVTLKYFDTGAAMTAAGVSGDWHGGWLGAPPALVGSQKWGLITSGIQFAENENQVMLVRKDDLEGKTPKELVTGGKILVVTNSTSQQVLFGCLDYLGVAASDVQMVPLDPSSIVQSFQAGQADVAMTWADVDFPLLRDPSYVKICNGDQAGVDVYCVYAVTPDFWSNHPEQAAAYVDAVYRAAEYMNDSTLR